jgi:hypothetical protein
MNKRYYDYNMNMGFIQYGNIVKQVTLRVCA